MAKKQQTLEEIKEGRLKTYRPLVIKTALIAYSLLFLASIIMFLLNVVIAWTNVGFTLLVLTLVHLGKSFKTVEAGQLGAVVIWGKPLYEVRSGLSYVPWLIGELPTETANQIQRQIPDEPEFIDKAGDDRNPQYFYDPSSGQTKQKALPIRVPSGSRESVLAMIPLNDNTPDTKLNEKRKQLNEELVRIQDRLKLRENSQEESKDDQGGKDAKKKKKASPKEEDPLQGRLTLEVTGVYTVRILDYVTFLEHIGSLSEAHRQLRDVFEAVMKEEFSRRTPALIIEDFPEINRRVATEVRQLIGEEINPDDPNPEAITDSAWGISIVSFQLIDIDLTKGVNQSLRDAVQEKFKLKSTITEADGARYKLEQIGAGDASAKRASLFAEVDAARKMQEEVATKPGGLDVLRLATAREALKEADYTIVPAGDLNGLFAGAMQTLQGIASHRQHNQQQEQNQTRNPQGKGPKPPQQKDKGAGGQGNKGQKPALPPSSNKPAGEAGENKPGENQGDQGQNPPPNPPGTPPEENNQSEDQGDQGQNPPPNPPGTSPEDGNPKSSA